MSSGIQNIYKPKMMPLDYSAKKKKIKNVIVRDSVTQNIMSFINKTHSKWSLRNSQKHSDKVSRTIGQAKEENANFRLAFREHLYAIIHLKM